MLLKPGMKVCVLVFVKSRHLRKTTGSTKAPSTLKWLGVPGLMRPGRVRDLEDFFGVGVGSILERY